MPADDVLDLAAPVPVTLHRRAWIDPDESPVEIRAPDRLVHGDANLRPREGRLTRPPALGR